MTEAGSEKIMANTVTTDATALVGIYESMSRMMAADDRLARGISTGEVQCVYWPSRGQEAIPASLNACLRADDRVVTTYRGLHDLIGKGVPLVEIFGEMLGREVGGSRGKGGTMHIVHPETGVLLTTGIVGSGTPVAVGLAMAAKRQGVDRVTAVNFGDGATSTGSFHEAANMASLWDLPLIFVCQNNQYAEFTPVEDTMKIKRVAERALAYGMAAVTVDGNDPLALLPAFQDAIDRARRGDGPTFVECVTFRFRGHYFGDKGPYIPDEQVTAAQAADPIPRFRAHLISAGAASEADLDALEARVAAEVDQAMAAVLAAAPVSIDELDRDIYAPTHSPA